MKVIKYVLYQKKTSHLTLQRWQRLIELPDITLLKVTFALLSHTLSTVQLWPLTEYANNDDNTFITTGSCPAGEAMTEEVALFVLAAHCASGVTGRWGALVWDILNKTNKE